MDQTYYLQFRDEHAKWISHNFPSSKAYQPLLGMIEEAGELSEASLMMKDSVERDSIGDILVYLTHYCNFHSLDWMECKRYYTVRIGASSNLLDLLIELGKLSHAQLKGEQSIRHTAEQIHDMKKVAVGNIIVLLEHHCNSINQTLLGCLKHAWDEVKHRDWIKNNKSGK